MLNISFNFRVKIIKVHMYKLSLALLFLFNFQIAIENEFKKEKEIIIKEYYKEIPDSIKQLPFKSFMLNLDRYTRVLDKEQKEIYNDYMLNRKNGNLGIMFDSTEFGFQIYSVYKKSDAFVNGLEQGDILMQINRVEPKSGEELENLIRGEVNTTVELKFKRDDIVFDVNLTRSNIAFDNVYAQKISKTAIISIDNFHLFSYMEFLVNSEYLEPEYVDTLIIDLRDNSGGLLRDCLDMVDEFVDEEALMISRISKNDTIKTYSTDGGIWSKLKQIIVLQNSQSASASEVLSSILQKKKGAIVVGETSFGKGLVQTVLEHNEKILIVTSSEYFTLGQNKIHEIGVIPDKPMNEMIFDNLPKNFNLKEFRCKYPNPNLEALKSPLLKGKKNVSHLIWGKDGELFEILIQKPYK
jgi:carboxyl-terminal processing protease